MTEDEINLLKEELKINELYIKSSSLYKDYQFEQFLNNKIPLEGKFLSQEIINSKEQFVILNFRNGLLNSNDEVPAVQYEGHWEYWNNGLISKVVDKNKSVEYWENGIPIRIEELNGEKEW